MNKSSWLDHPISEKFPALTLEILLFSLIVVLAVITRFAFLGDRAMSHDESLHTYYSYTYFRDGLYHHDPMMHGPLQFHLLPIFYFFFGVNDFTARMAAALFSIATIWMTWCWRRYLGSAGALAAGFMLLISPFLLYYGRYARNEAFVGLFGIVMLFSVLRYFETGQHKYLYLLTLSIVLHFCAKETAYIYTAELLVFLLGYMLIRILQNEWKDASTYKNFIIALIVAVGAGGSALTATLVSTNAGGTPSALSAGLGVIGLAGLVAAIIFVFRGYGLARLREERSFDMLILVGTLTLPLLAAPLIAFAGGNPLDYSTAGIRFSAPFLIALTLPAIIIGLLWNIGVWSNAAILFYAIFIILFTSIFTNPQGFYSGLLGSLGYWLTQQSVERGSQPFYYYFLIQIPVYEYLPAMASLLALYFGFRRRDITPSTSPQVDTVSTNYNNTFALLAFWAISSLAVFTIAGEKMPWLTYHIALAFILLGGFGINQLLERVDWGKLRHSGLVIILMLIFILSSLATLISFLGNTPPFQGKETIQIQATYTFLLFVLASIGSGAGLFYYLPKWEKQNTIGLGILVYFGILALLTIRTSFMANYVNEDSGKEFLVYAHSFSGVKDVLKQIDDISFDTTGDHHGIAVAYDDDVAWPFTWYMREFPNAIYYANQPGNNLTNSPVILVGDSNYTAMEPIAAYDYYREDYIRMVWPTQDYFNLTLPRIANALRDPQLRQGIFNIWLNRDYSLYAQTVPAYAQVEGGYIDPTSYQLDNWTPSDRMRIYVRKDIAEQLWEYGKGQALVVQPDPYEKGKVDLFANLIFGSGGTEPGQFNGPRQISFAPDGSFYVADSRNNRIQHFTQDGQFINTWGFIANSANETPATGGFNEPWGIAVAPDGSVFVADTWNHRIQKFSADGQFVKAWGQFGNAEMANGFYGPRQISIDASGRVYVADTGNNRIIIFDGEGNQLGVFGSVGLEAGQFYEPTGVAVGQDGRIYVADTWNQRIQVFEPSADFTSFPQVAEWPINGWFSQNIENKPQIAVDVNNHVYVTDPEGFRILEFDGTGNFITTWGGPGVTDNSFSQPSGVAVDSQGNIWVTDAGDNNRVMRFVLP